MDSKLDQSLTKACHSSAALKILRFFGTKNYKQLDLSDTKNNFKYYSKVFYRKCINVSTKDTQFPENFENVIRNLYVFSDTLPFSCAWGFHSTLVPGANNVEIECFCYIIFIKQTTPEEINVGKKCIANLKMIDPGGIYENRSIKQVTIKMKKNENI